MTDDIPPPPPGFTMVPSPPPGFQIVPTLPPIDPAQVDLRTGAPARVRERVGGSPEQDRLANLRRYYPDARPYGEENFVFTDPRSGRPTLYNPKGLDIGDAASIGRDITQAIGGGLGAAAGAVVGTFGGPLGTAGGTALGAGFGTAGAGAAYDLSANLLGNRIDTRNATQRLTDTGVDFLGGAVGQRGGEMLSDAARNAAVGVGRAGSNLIDRTRDAFAATGVRPTAGSVTGSRAIQSAESALGNMPTSAGRMQAEAERVMAEMRLGADRVAAGFGPVQTPQGAGETIRAGAREAGERFAARRLDLDNQVEQLIGRDTRVPVQAVRGTLQALENIVDQSPETAGPRLAGALQQLRRVADDATAQVDPITGAVTRPDGIPFGALRAARTALGAELDHPDISGYTNSQMRSLRRAYGALRQDIEAAADAAGDDARRALQTHDRYVRFNRQDGGRLETLQRIEDLGTDEAAFNYAVNASKDGGSKLTGLRRNLTAPEWDTVAASVLDRMGLARAGAQDATGDVFSPSTFMTNWSKMSPEAKDALFGSRRHQAVRDQLDHLVTVADSLKQAEKMGNPSGTARNLAYQSLFGALGGATGYAATGDGQVGAGALVGTMVAPQVAARLLTSPSFVRWLSAAPAAAGHANGLAEHLGRLAGIGGMEPKMRDAIGQYLDALRAPGTQTPEGTRTSQ